MPNWSIIPKEMKFFAYFQQQAENTVKMAQQLRDMVYVWQDIKERAKVLADMEQDGDAITHDVMSLLQRTFVPPFDREDVSELARSLGDIADLIHAAADTLYLYGVESPTDRAKELCDMILVAVQEVESSISDMSASIRKPELLRRSTTIYEIEDSADLVYRKAKAELFARPDDLAYIVKWREIYQKMEATINACKTFGKVLEGIAIKYG
jgi:uncharacterized protein